MKVKGIFLIVIATTILLISCSSNVRIKKEVFEKIELGMTIEEVKAILGEPVEIRKMDSLNTYYFTIRNDMIASEYAQVRFDKLGRACFKFYGNPA
ncbi:MAG TPA: outer membrane protein assembly factor BamE [Chitinophagaceae bacterium]